MLKVLFLLILSFPLFASTDLYIKSLENESVNRFCGSVEIAAGVYATAAHCINEFDKSEIQVGANKNKITKFIIHEFYMNNFKYDQLDFSIFFSSSLGDIAPVAKVKLNDIIDFKGMSLKVVEESFSEFKAIPVGDKSACLNDSGSPAYVNNKLVGILSRGDAGCKKFAIFTKITTIIDWYKNENTINKYAKKSKDINLSYLISKLRSKSDKRNK